MQFCPINPTSIRLCIWLSGLLVVSPCLHAQHGWQADSVTIKKRQQQRPNYRWLEAEVPSYELPDPLLAADGSRVTSPEAWRPRRKELLDLFRHHMYGLRPGRPEGLSFEVVEERSSALDGKATLKRVVVHSTHEGRIHQFEVILFLPNAVTEPVPVFLLLNNRDRDITDSTRKNRSDFWPVEEVVERGFGIAAIQNNELAPDDTARFHKGIIALFEGEFEGNMRAPDAWGAIAAWGWGASRAMDYFLTDPRIDATRIAVLGHSRGGKAALWVGAEDERFALVISNESGCGGAALSRRRYGETIRAVNRFTHWFNGNFKAFGDRESQLPFDQHMLLALIAPRAVYVASADEDLWADPRGEFLSLAHSSPVYALWGEPAISPDEMPPINQTLRVGQRGYHIRDGNHNLTMVDWSNFMDYADYIWRRE